MSKFKSKSHFLILKLKSREIKKKKHIIINLKLHIKLFKTNLILTIAILFFNKFVRVCKRNRYNCVA